MIFEYFLKKQSAKFLDGVASTFKCKLLHIDRYSTRDSVHLQVLMLEGLLRIDALCRVEFEDLTQQIEGERVGIREEFPHRSPWAARHSLEMCASSCISYGTNGLRTGTSAGVDDKIELVLGIMAREEGAALVEHLGKDAADRPHINSGGVVGRAGHNELRGSVPAGGDVVGPEDDVWLLIIEGSAGEAEVDDAEVALGVDQDVGGLEVAVEDAGGVNVVYATNKLEDQPANMLVGQLNLRAKDAGQISGHEFEDDKYVVEAVAIGREKYVLDGDDILVSLEQTEELELAKRASSFGSLLKDAHDAFDGDLLAGLHVDCGADDAVAAFADYLLEAVLVLGERGKKELLLEPVEQTATLVLVAGTLHGGFGKAGMGEDVRVE